MTDNSIALSQKIASFITKAEYDQQALALDNADFTRYLDEKESHLNHTFSHISDEIAELKERMSHSSNIQWRRHTEQLLHENKKEMTSLGAFYHEAHSHILAQCDRLNQATMSTVKSAAQFFVSIKNNSLQKLAETKSQELEKTCEKNLSRVKRTVQSLRWKNLLTAFCLSLIVSFIVSLYIDNKSPWLAHEQVLQQREAGKVLLASWQHLSQNDQNIIIQSA